MNNFVFNCPTKVLFGEGESTSIGAFSEELNIKRPLLITDEHLLNNGLIDIVLEGLDEANIKYLVYSDVPPDSDTDSVNRAKTFARENGCNSVIAIGGGSVIDTAKVVNMCVSRDSTLLENQGLNILSAPLNPLIVVPTTAGTGSEVTFVATIKDSKENKKLVYGSKFLAPDIAILDPEMIRSLPPKLTAATGMDAITHAIEALACSITASVLTEVMALESLRMLFEYLPRAYETPDDMEARSQTLVASTMAGIAFTNTGVGIIHALAHATGAKFKTHHGMTNAVFLPHGMRFNQDQTFDIYGKVARCLGFADSKTSDEKASCILISKFESLMSRLNIPNNLKSLGVPNMDDSQLLSWSNLVLEDPAIMFNPKYATAEDVVEIYKRAY